MRVILVTSWFLSLNRPRFSPFLREFIQRLADNGVEVSLYAPHPPEKTGFERISTVKSHRAMGPLGFAAFVAELLGTPATLVHVQRPSTYTAAFVLVARVFNKPVVTTIHLAEVLPDPYSAWRMVRRAVLRLCDQIICVSEATRRLAIESGCPQTRTITIYNTVNERRFRPRPRKLARKILGLSTNETVVLFVGHLRADKGTESLLQAFTGIKQGCRLIIIGEGPLRGYLTRLAKELNLSDRVHFTGYVKGNLLPLYYNACDIFILPSRLEGHSLALLEALASGIPVIATWVGGNKETIINGWNGLTVPYGDVTSLHESLERLIASPSLRRKLGIAARRTYIEKFSENTHLSRTLSLYQSLLIRI